jgi:hypothetical protein
MAGKKTPGGKSNKGRSGRLGRLGIAPLLVAMSLGTPASALAAAGKKASGPAIDSHRWGLVIAAVFFGILFFIWRRVVVGKDGPLSTSKFVAAVWTYLVASALGGFVYAHLMDHPQAINAMKSGLAGDYAVLIGGPIGAAVLALSVRISKENQAAGAAAAAAAVPGTSPGTPAEAPAVTPSAGDLVKSDDGEENLGKLQYIFFNLVAMVFVVGTVIKQPTLGLPEVPDVLLGLTAVSAAGYVANKAVKPVST